MSTTTSLARCALILSALALAATGGLLFAGPLDPPVGPISPTYKTLSEVQPRIAINTANTPGDADSLYKIVAPGSYYLTGNITGVAGKHGIEVVASGVTLDLSGFELLGVPASLDGVSATVGVNNVEVRSGSVRSWGDEGLDFTNGGSISVTDVSVLSCAGFGISINQNSTATRCRASYNGAGGIATGNNCVVTGCTAQGNTGGGILAWIGCTVVDCTAMVNTGNGISANNGSTISGCTATDNSRGISVTDGSTISDCSASSNDGDGFFATQGVTISGCSARSNLGNGFHTSYACTLAGCSAGENTGDGIDAYNGCTITRCSVFSNSGIGIDAGGGSTVADCTVVASTLDGIRCSGACVIRGNDCVESGTLSGDGANIHVLASNAITRIEGNNCVAADRGIDVDGGGNIIIRNTCSGNTTNWDVVAGNTILVVQGSSAPAVVGNAGGLAPGSIDPNANFTR